MRGSNGSGKSTLLRLLAGATMPSRGERVAAAGVTVGYGPERLAPPPPFSVAAYLRRHARLRGLDRAEGERRTGALVERLGLGALTAERLEALSKGSLQKVVLVQALLGEPRLAVLDEPYAGLDGEAQDAVRGLIAEQAARRADGRVQRPPAAHRRAVGRRPRVAHRGRARRHRRDRARTTSSSWRSRPQDGDAELASLLARGWHVVSYAEGRGDTPARIRARRP